MTTTNQRLLIGLISWVLLAPAKAAEVDLSSFGSPVETTAPAGLVRSKVGANKRWSAEVCAEIQRIEDLVTSGSLRPADRGMARGGLLMLEQLHCGVDVSGKLAVDQAVLDQEEREARRAYQENMEAAVRAAEHEASTPREPIIVQVPQAAPAPSLPDPSPTMNCFTTRLGGGMSSTTCR